MNHQRPAQQGIQQWPDIVGCLDGFQNQGSSLGNGCAGFAAEVEIGKIKRRDVRAACLFLGQSGNHLAGGIGLLGQDQLQMIAQREFDCDHQRVGNLNAINQGSEHGL